jgi:hypothetical protein
MLGGLGVCALLDRGASHVVMRLADDRAHRFRVGNHRTEIAAFKDEAFSLAGRAGHGLTRGARGLAARDTCRVPQRAEPPHHQQCTRAPVGHASHVEKGSRHTPALERRRRAPRTPEAGGRPSRQESRALPRNVCGRSKLHGPRLEGRSSRDRTAGPAPRRPVSRRRIVAGNLTALRSGLRAGGSTGRPGADLSRFLFSTGNLFANNAVVRSGILGVALRQRRGCRSFGQ